MIEFNSEEDLREPVRNWISGQDLHPIDEMPLWGKIPDLVAKKGGKVEIAIELKLSNWKRALYQATIYATFAKRSYIAMPEDKMAVLDKNRAEIEKWGVRILIVKRDESVVEIHTSCPQMEEGG